jgi:hypothetical protein
LWRESGIRHFRTLAFNRPLTVFGQACATRAVPHKRQEMTELD